MIICELTYFNEFDSPIINVAPFVYSMLPASHTTADYWINTFGAPDESTTVTIFITEFIRAITNYYIKVNDLEDCINQEASFFWNTLTEILYVHYEHNQLDYTSSYELGTIRGYSDKDSIYINDLYYNSLIESIPSISQQQDLINYDKLSFMSGSIGLINVQGVLDSFIDQNNIGTPITLYYLGDLEEETIIRVVETGDTREAASAGPDTIARSANSEIMPLNYSRNDLVPLATFYLEDVTIGLGSIKLNVQDIRKKQNIEIPIDVFTIADYPNIKEKYIGDIIPLMYGQVRISKAIPVNGDVLSGTVTYRQALLLTTLGTVQVEIDDLWTTKTPISTDISTGSFILSESDGRKTNGEPYSCRVLDSIGIINIYSSDIIKDLNNRYIDTPYNDSNYDTPEWEVEETQLETIGILFNESLELFEAIRLVQSGSNKGYRYEIEADGRRTIRIDDPDRIDTIYISNNNILNINQMLIKTNTELLSAFVKVEYGYDYDLNKYKYIIDNSQSNNVLQNYREQPTVSIETSLVTQTQAEERGELYADRFSEIPEIISVKLLGIEYYTLRIYDIIELEITSSLFDGNLREVVEGREFYGLWRVQILSINPDFDNLSNSITAYLINKIEQVVAIRVTDTGTVRSSGVIGTETLKRAIGV